MWFRLCEEHNVSVENGRVGEKNGSQETETTLTPSPIFFSKFSFPFQTACFFDLSGLCQTVRQLPCVWLFPLTHLDVGLSGSKDVKGREISVCSIISIAVCLTSCRVGNPAGGGGMTGLCYNRPDKTAAPGLSFLFSHCTGTPGNSNAPHFLLCEGSCH